MRVGWWGVMVTEALEGLGIQIVQHESDTLAVVVNDLAVDTDGKVLFLDL